MEKPYDSAIPLLAIYLKDMKSVSQRDIYTSIFIAALFMIANIWKQPKCPSMDEWIKKMWYIFTQWNIIQPLKRGNLAICSNMNGPEGCNAK